MKSSVLILIENVLLTILSIAKITLLSSFFSKLRFGGDNVDCVILGNGPSLNDFIEHHKWFLRDKDIVAVNYFVRSEFFTQLKPNYYVITSPEYWKKDEKEGWSADRFITFELLVERTNWPMRLFVPNLARKDEKWKAFMQQNENIDIIYFNNVTVAGFKSFRHWAYRHNLGMPRPHNVVIPALIFMINNTYENIYLTGVEHSWIKELTVTENNDVLLSQKHFYEYQKSHVKSVFSDGKPKPMYIGESAKPRRLHEVLIKFYYTFQAYWQIKAYADIRNVRVHNLTMDSFIDAFPKFKLRNSDE